MILDEFVLLFKSDAKQASADVAELLKKIELLKDKGKGRTTEENKQLAEYTKQLKEQSEVLKINDQQYQKIAESAAAYVTAAISGSSLIKNIFGSAENNAQLALTAKTYGLQTKELNALALANEQAGGSQEEFIASQVKLVQLNSQLGGAKTDSPDRIITRLRAQLEGLDQATKLFKINQWGLPPLPLLIATDERYNQVRKSGESLSQNIESQTAAASEFRQEWVEIKEAVDNVTASATAGLLPVIRELNKLIIPILTGIAKSPVGSLVTEAGAGIGATLLAKSFAKKLLPGIFKNGVGVAEGAAGVGAAGIGAVGGTFLGSLGLLFGLKSAIDEKTHGANALRYGKTNEHKSSHAEIIKRSSEPEENSPYLLYQHDLRHKNDLSSLLQSNQSALALASSLDLTPGSYQNSNSRTVNVKVGDINISSNASDTTGIASDISTQLERHINAAISNMDDGVQA
jgi:hypothetical protein